MSEYKGQCFCGQIQWVALDKPLSSGYCHCEMCRKWSGCTLQATAIYKLDKFSITAGENKTKSHRTGKYDRYWCTECGGSCFSILEDKSIVSLPFSLFLDVSAGLFPKALAPKGHFSYDERILDIPDGLRKIRGTSHPSVMWGVWLKELIPSVVPWIISFGLTGYVVCKAKGFIK